MRSKQIGSYIDFNLSHFKFISSQDGGVPGYGQILAATQKQACETEATLISASNSRPISGRLSSQTGAIESCGSIWTRPLVARNFGESSSQGTMSWWEEGRGTSCVFTNIETVIRVI